jgi:stage II sporulation protein AB (anti-sigma F factor)
MAGAGHAAREWSLPAELASVTQARHAVGAFVRAAGARRSVEDDICLAVSEAVTNAVIHGYVGRAKGTVRIRARVGGEDDVEISVQDDGAGLQPRPDSPGLGMGLPLIARTSDEMKVSSPEGGGTILAMRFRFGSL